MAVEPFAVGFDLGKEYSQICCWNADTKEPVSISVVAGAEKYRIPTESLELFLKKAMRLLKPFGKVHEAEAVVFSVEETTSPLPATRTNPGTPDSKSYCEFIAAPA